MQLSGKKILLVISGGIAAYKALELIRQLRKSGAHVRCILTQGGAQFVTPLSIAALTEEQVYTDLFSLKDETEMGHIRLSREADLILVAPASANIIAQMTHGLAEDLASTALLATNRPVMVCPAMNPMMWQHEATQNNIKTLEGRGIKIIGPDNGDMACGETGAGRMSEPESIVNAVNKHFQDNKPLAGRTAIVTSGPTYEPIDPVRFIGNRSSGKQGHAIAQSLSNAGAAVFLVTGPVSIPAPQGIETIPVNTADEMLDTCEDILENPTDIVICAAAVADWKVAEPSEHKIKKQQGEDKLTLTFTKNPDILHTIATRKTGRPDLVVGFAAETERTAQNATDKRLRKDCDWILANNIGDDDVFGTDQNRVHFITNESQEEWPLMKKDEIARDLTTRIIEYFEDKETLKEKNYG